MLLVHFGKRLSPNTNKQWKTEARKIRRLHFLVYSIDSYISVFGFTWYAKGWIDTWNQRCLKVRNE